MAAELEITSNPLDHVVCLFRPDQPFFKLGTAQTLVAGTDHDDRAAVSHGMLRVVKRFLGLIEVGVLRCAAL